MLVQHSIALFPIQACVIRKGSNFQAGAARSVPLRDELCTARIFIPFSMYISFEALHSRRVVVYRERVG